MKAYERIAICVVLVSMLVFLGCSKKDDTSTAPPAESGAAAVDAGSAVAAKVDEAKPVAEVKAEAEKMDLSALRETALKYKELIISKEAQITQLAEQLKQIPLAEKLGDEAKGVQSEITTLTKSVSALLERFNIYYDKLKAMGGDVSGLK